MNTSQTFPIPPPRTIAEFLLEEAAGRSVELLGGDIVDKAMPTVQHAEAQTELASQLRGKLRQGGGRPGGWTILVEVDVRFGEQVLRPDISGWRQERAPGRGGKMATTVPDWVCEVLSPSTTLRDLGVKRALYWNHHVDHYWVIDPERRFLTVLGWQPSGYVILAVLGPPEKAALAPFPALEVDTTLLFPDEPTET